MKIGKKWKIRKSIELPGGLTGVYGLALCFQVTQERAAIVINLRRTGQKGCDFELGNDIFLFDKPGEFTSSSPITFLRSFAGKHPVDGSDVYFVRYDSMIGFVPEGELLPDGRPHPHAGTGFCMGTSITLPMEAVDSGACDVYSQNKGWFAIITQMEYKDGTLHEKSRQIIKFMDYFQGAVGPGLASVVFDGEDILVPFTTKAPGDFGNGILRMSRCGDGDWKPAGFQMIAPEKGDNPPLFAAPSDGDGLSGCEPSLARMNNGNVVFTCREWGANPWSPEPLDASRGRIWTGCPSTDSFRLVFEKPYFHTLSPITVGATWSGKPYLVANEYSRTDWRGKSIPSLNIREKLLLYPLQGDDCQPQEPLVLCNALAEFGDPGQIDGGWFVDHPQGCRLRLEGRERNFVTWRVFNVMDTIGQKPSENSAAWMAEIFDGEE